MILIGRLTKNATITTLKDERKVVNFSLAINDWYKPKGSEQGIKVTTYINCSYWLSTAIATRLTKGTLIELSGRLQVNAYIGFDGEAKGTLNCHVNSITIHHTVKDNMAAHGTTQPNTGDEVKDDLPF